jgi:hypothetical protein
MKNIFIAALLLVVSCNYKSESEKYDDSDIRIDCILINTHKDIISLKEEYLKRINRTIKETGKVTPEQQIELRTIPLEIDTLKAEIDSLKAEISKKKSRE